MQTVGSREYKMMLHASKFVGDETKLKEAAKALWGDLAGIIMPHAISISGTEDVSNKYRAVRFFETGDGWLRANDYVVRERFDAETDERQITLKFRHPDRYISQGRDMSPADGLEQDMKFEEDIKPPFLKLYSYSSSVIAPKGLELTTLKDVSDLFPGLPKSVDNFPEDAALEIVGDFTARERVIKGTSFQIRKDPQTQADCSLTVWYPGEETEKPAVAEFSFKYEDEKEGYTAKMAQRAYGAYQSIQEELTAWIDAKSMTKTAYVYGLKGTESR